MTVTNAGAMAPQLNELLNGEMEAARFYFQAAAWCNQRNMAGCQSFLLGHANEELDHMRRFLAYLFDLDFAVKIAEMEAPEIKAETPREMFAAILETEKQVTRNIYAATTRAEEEGDHATFEFLQWFVREQREEETLFSDILDKIDLIGDGPHAKYFIDREIAAMGQK
ncbi:ferritin [Martelella radicis]|uniref:Ferritin n=1 Tax=Martelella radicis TaxID=1397476 RepID=A0A7W6KJ48_9HYPH|nr:ferritin [Martelella radicis]MBB4120893.1 ferritin [Martelella radicis]